MAGCTLILWALFFFLLSANALVGLTWATQALVVLPLVGREEAQLLVRYGDAYQNYQERTGCFLPRWK